MLSLLPSTKDTGLEPVEVPCRMIGLQSLAADYTRDRLHILQRLITDPLNIFYFEAGSDEMDLFGIKKGSLLIVDRAKTPTGGMIVIARHKGEWLLRQLIAHPKKKYLTTGKEEDPMVEIKEAEGIVIWGVVIWSCCPQTEVKR